MMFKTHLVFGLLLGIFALEFFTPPNKLIFILVVLAASALPDIDHPDSKVGKNIKIIGMLFRHRGFFHSIWALALFAVGINMLFNNTTITAAFVIGYISHIIIDMLTHAGVMPFHPISSWKIKGFLKSNSFGEYIVAILIILIAFWKIFGL